MARFIVTEVEGYPVRAGFQEHLSPNRKELLSVSVVDTAYNYEEVARFNEEDSGYRIGTPSEVRRESIRNRAAGLAWMLNDDEKEV